MNNSKNKNNNAFDFDLGLSSNTMKPIKPNNSSSYNQSTNQRSSWTQQPNKPAWSHQPVGSLNGPTSMVGDISGKSWNSTPTSSIGIVNSKNPNLFSDLLGSSIANKSSNSNVPLKNVGKRMENVADSMPKYGNSWGSSVSSVGNAKSSNLGVSSGNSMNLGGPSMKNIGINKDPFGSLVDFSTKKLGSMNMDSKGNDSFGDFQNAASKPSETKFSGFEGKKADPMGEFVSNQSSGTNSFDPMGDFMSSNQNKGSSQSSGTDGFDVFFSSPADGGMKGSEDVKNEQFSGAEDWDFGGGDGGAGTTELEGLPPPPAGVSASSAKTKGTDNYKQGQFADAIKWLSWAVVLFEKAGNGDGTMEVLTCRASCYKEVGEYKKAVADCTKVLEHDKANVSVLVQRALLYESMEKYKLGAEDLRTVMKLDPSNRVARSTIHRLTKMADL